ncbi:MAG: hypothetical protein ACOX41_02430 [Anaerovoracaceae bacterium]|jgi:hypothetical protein
MGYVKGGKVRRPGCLLASGPDLQERQRTGNRDNKHDSNDGFRIHSDSLLSVKLPSLQGNKKAVNLLKRLTASCAAMMGGEFSIFN